MPSGIGTPAFRSTQTHTTGTAVVSFENYALDPAIYDEMFLPDGSPRPEARILYDSLAELSPADLATIQGRVNRTFSNESISFTVYGDAEAEERIIPVDPIPRVIAANDWQDLVPGPGAAGPRPQ